MSQEFNIKDVRFTTITMSGGVTPSGLVTAYSDRAIQGRILDVEWTANCIGSVALQFSGTNIEFFRRNAPSGAGWQMTEPRVLTQGTAGSTAAMWSDNFYINEPIFLRYDIGSNAVGNTSGLGFTVNVKYQ